MNIFGFNVPFEMQLDSFFSSSWIWVAVVGLIGFILIIVLCIFLFFYSYKRVVVVFEEQGGQLVPIMKTRARVLKLGAGGTELMKTLAGGMFLSAYGKRVGKNQYWYIKGTDGYYYNFILDKFGTPIYIDGDMRLTNVAINRMAEQTYGKTNFLEKYGLHIAVFIFLLVLIFGMWLLIGKFTDGLAPLVQSAETNAKLTQANVGLTGKITQALKVLGIDETTSGLQTVGT